MQNIDLKSTYEGFMIIENKNGAIIYINNDRIPIYVYFCIILLIFGFFLLSKGFLDTFGFILLLIISLGFITIGLKNRVDIPIINITNNSIIFNKKNHIQTKSIKDIIINTETKFYFNFLGVFFTYPHRIIFLLNNNSSIDINITFALKKNAQNFINHINKILK